MTSRSFTKFKLCDYRVYKKFQFFILGHQIIIKLKNKI